MNCEKCKRAIDGSYGSGRFCSRFCANSRIRSNDVKEKISKSLTKEKEEAICKECSNVFKRKRKSQLFCSRPCARTNNFKLARIAQKENPPNWSEIHKLSYRLGKNFVSGGTTKWLHYKNIKVQGSYELRMCYILDKMKQENVILDWEYTKDHFPYIDVDGKERTYFLDFKVFTNDGFFYIETKGYKTETDEAKWSAVRKMGLKLDVLFDKDILKLENHYLN